MRVSHALRRWLPVIVLFTLLSGVALAPLSLHMNSEVPGAPEDKGRVLDYYHFHWNLWWMRHAVSTGQDFWYTDMVLAPGTHNLTYHSLTASMLPFYAVLEPLVGHLRAANGIIWISLTLTGLLLYAFLRSNEVSRPTALLGGVALAMSPYMLDHAGSGHLNLLTVWWLPMVLWTWEKTDRAVLLRQGLAWSALTGLILWGMWFTDTLIVLWGGLLLGPYALYSLLKAPGRAARLRLIMCGGLALLITVALSYAIGPLRQTVDFDTSQLPPARLLTLRYYSLDLQDIVLPKPGAVQKYGTESDETLGLLLVLLTVIALFVRHKGTASHAPTGGTRANHYRWFWLLAALPALILALGPDERIFGVRVVMPFRIIHELFNGQMRTPLRFLPPATVGLVIFLALTFDPWLQRIKRPTLRGGIALLAFAGFVLDYGVLLPFPTIPALEPYDFHYDMRAEHYDNYDYVVLDVPSGPFTGWRDVGSHPEAMVYGITHEKREVSGLLSRIPIDEHLFYEQDPLMGWLTESRPLDASAAAAKLKQFVDQWPIGYVVVHMDWLTPQKLQETLAFFNAHESVCYITIERDAVLYRTTSHPKGCPPRTPALTGADEFTIHFGEPDDNARVQDVGFIGHGWYAPEDIGGELARWAGGRNEALLYATLPPEGAYTVTFRVVAFHDTRTVKVVAAGRVVDGEPHVAQLGTFTAEPGAWAEHTLTIPTDLIAEVGGDLVFSLSADGMISAAEAGLSADMRPLTLAYDWVRFVRE